jgi:heat shock protein HslJ
MMKRTAVFGLVMLLVTLLGSCIKSETGGIRPDAIGIEGPEWHLVEVSGIPVSSLASERIPFIKFDALKNEAAGYAGCNNFFGGYELDGSSLKFGTVVSTRMFCPDLQMSLETEVFKALDKTRGWDIRNGELLLLDGSEVLARCVMVREEKNIQEITGTVWQWVHTLYNDDRKLFRRGKAPCHRDNPLHHGSLP